MPQYVEMESLLRELKGFAKRDFPKDEVDRYLGETLVEPKDLDRYVSYCEERYTRHLIHKDEDFELLVLCWSSGQAAPIHGHEGELCWARVERGCLRFANYEMVSEAPMRLELIDTPTDGKVGFLDGPAEIHSVENLGAFGAHATSLHLYSKPYGECDVYESQDGPCKRVRLSYDTIEGRPVETSIR